MSFVDGVVGNGVDFAGNKYVCYPLQNNFALNMGTIEFLITAPDQNSLGFFDIGHLGTTNSCGIFKNKDRIIMEVKNNINSYDQAWNSSLIIYDGNWHLISAVWERQDEITRFKLCYDGECRDNYDGFKSDSFPDLSENFCVGWCGWYGFSESSFDELKIFDYVKSDSEIIDTYESYFPERLECEGDFEPDGDVDGIDLANEINEGGFNISELAEDFGRVNCPDI